MKKRSGGYPEWKVLLLRLGTVLAVFIICKLFFFLFNKPVPLEEERGSFSYVLNGIAGIFRYDLSAIAFLNTPYLFLTLLPFRFTYNKIYRGATTLLVFYLPNIAAFAFDFGDIIYSRFTQRRMTWDVFKFVGQEEGIAGLVPVFFRDYWYIFLLFFLVVGCFIFVNRKLGGKRKRETSRFSVSHALPAFALFLAGAFLAARGGVQLRPLSALNVSSHAAPRHYIYITNTPFTLLKSVGKSALQLQHYMSDEEAERYYSPIWRASPGGGFNKRNIVILIVESLSAEHTRVLNPKLERSHTPHLDSIGRRGQMMLLYANGTRSMEGVPAIIAGLPTWMDGEYLTSPYAGNMITALPALLRGQGYASAFFHGGENGTMNFQAFTETAGFDLYFGKNEYGNNAHFDGNWGIFDDFYLPYAAREITKLDTPFLTSIFTLSSHHPFNLPPHYLASHPKVEKGMPASIEYADWALGKFFAEAERQPWFSNTLFIITGDHAARPADPDFQSRHTRYAIPLVIFDPAHAVDTIRKSFGQQIDLLPTLLDMLHYPKDCFAFGKSLTGRHPPFAVNFQNGIYQMVTERHILLFDGAKPVGYYDRREDPQMEHDRTAEANDRDDEWMFFKSIIQQYNKDLIQNKLTIESTPLVEKNQ